MFSTKSYHQGYWFCRVVSYLNVKSLPWGTEGLDVPAAFCFTLGFLKR